jgi:hypothetical protein
MGMFLAFQESVMDVGKRRWVLTAFLSMNSEFDAI